MMSKRLVFIAVAALSIIHLETAEAKVCWLGDTSPECVSANTSLGAAECDSSYKECANPRAGATYCIKNGEALYKDEDCCTTLNYHDCPKLNGGDKSNGYGQSCLGAKDNIRYYEFCGCPYGFVDVGDTENLSVTGEEGYDNLEIPYAKRCTYMPNAGTTSCKFATCSAERRWFNKEDGEWCKYRLPTRCGGFGCIQLFNCNNNINGNEYYRNEEYYLSGSNVNFIGYDENDPLSNEKDRAQERNNHDQYGRTGNRASPYSSLITGRNEDGSLISEIYEVTNKLICAYKTPGSGATINIGSGEGGVGGSCNGVENYCYQFDTGRICNTDRGWYHSYPNAGIIYQTNDAYINWMKYVEAVAGFNYKGDYPARFKAINEVFEYKDNSKALRQEFLNHYTLVTGTSGTNDFISSVECERETPENCNIGCIYVTHECHGNSRDCFKRIACNEGKRFYHSFINAAKESLYNVATNTSFFYWKEYEKLNKQTDANGLYLVNLDSNQIDRYVYPACVYEIDACNDTPDEGNAGGGCYRKVSCATDFIEGQNFQYEEDWAPWFRDVRPVCNDLTRCYKATSCEISVGAYSSEPNTSFFITGHSTASGVTCYRGFDCRYEAGAYSSTPNTSFFFVIDSSASGSICYRGESCHVAAGAYSSTPNTSFFTTITSKSSGSIAYRADKVREDAGAYSSTPNTSFFFTISSSASGSKAYRAERFHKEAGAYSSTPNTSFFFVIDSMASGSVAYRAQAAHLAAGAYSSTPNTSFFVTNKSLASGSTAYRAERTHEKVGAYTSAPNTSFFFVIKSIASGSTAYRAQSAHFAAGSYSSTPNTSFFITNNSLASGSIAYRAEKTHEKAGAYTSTPNTSFFFVIDSAASGSVAYRAQSAHFAAGAYSSTPNTSFFITVKSEASGSVCYRGIQCREIEGGSYTTSPNTEFFDVIYSKASGSECYRGQNCGENAGAYSSSPNTSFFVTIKSGASGSICYRGESCYTAAGSYSSTPNTSFFNVINSAATNLTCYRGENCSIEIGAYTSAPNAVFFKTIESAASGSSCYRGEKCAPTANPVPETSFFLFVNSKASGSTCYRSTGCNLEEGAYSSNPNTSFFVVEQSTNAEQDSTCYRGTKCHTAAGAYSSTPNTSFFITNNSLASGSTCYRGVECHVVAGAYSSTPNTSFFSVVNSKASGSVAYRANSTHIKAGAYTSAPNTSFFITNMSLASGSTAYRAESAHILAGAYSSTPNTIFFHVVSSKASGSVAYRADYANFGAGAYTSAPNTSFFDMGASLASGSKSYRGGNANIPAGAYSSAPNTSFFFVISSKASGSTAYRAESAHIKAGAYSSTPNTAFFSVISSLASGSISYRAQSANIGNGAYSSTPNTSFFITNNSLASGSIAYRAKSAHIAAGAYSSTPNALFFSVITSKATGLTCYRGEKCAKTANANPNTNYFIVVDSKASGSTCYRSTGCNYEDGAYSSMPNTSFFRYESSTNAESDSTCYRGTGCHEAAGAYSFGPNTSFFTTVDSESSGLTCYRGTGCHIATGAYSSRPNVSFFVTTYSKASGKTCYRGKACKINAGAYSSTPNISFFVTSKSETSGSTCYRGENCNIAAGSYSSTPNISFFMTSHSKATGSSCYRGESCHIAAGAYSSTPNTSFFMTSHSKATGLTCYRGENCNASAGAYSSSPNESFFKTTASKATGLTCYRADNGCADNAKTRADEINSSFFYITKSDASGVVCYRGDTCNIPAGAYSSHPNESFFNTIRSLSPTNSTECFRGDRCNTANGAYSSSPNISFFITNQSKASGSTCYRGTGCHIAVGAYSSTPNTMFFDTVKSEATGSTCYRGTRCRRDYSFTEAPNTSFFMTIHSEATGVTCYRSDKCHIAAGSYSSTPNTSFFTTSSKAPDQRGADGQWDSSTCHRGTGCHILAGAYSSSPNTSFFMISYSKASGSTCYRGENCNTAAGAYSSTPNTSFFMTSHSKASGKTCYRGTECADGGAYSSTPNTSFFITNHSIATGSTCYRGKACNIAAGAYSSTPNEAFFITVKSEATGKVCYRGKACDEAKYSYKHIPSQEPDLQFFAVVSSFASGISCYKVTDCAIANGAYSSTPNTSFFMTAYKKKDPKECYRGTRCHVVAGAYSSTPNTVFFNTVKSEATGIMCYRGTKCRTNYSYDVKPDTSFFMTSHSEASGSTCYRIEGCNLEAGAYSSRPNISFFVTSYAGKTQRNENDSTQYRCYRGTECRAVAGAYTSTPNTSFFATASSMASGSTCYRGTRCHILAGAYSSAPNTMFFNTVKSGATGSTCYRATGCATGAVSSIAGLDEDFFDIINSKASGSTCYRINCKGGLATEEPSSCVFIFEASAPAGSGIQCYNVKGCQQPSPDTCLFTTGTMPAGETECTIATGVANSSPDTNIFTTSSVTTNVTENCQELTASYATGCKDTNYWYASGANDGPGSCYFATTSRTSNICGNNVTCEKVNGIQNTSNFNSCIFITGSVKRNGNNYQVTYPSGCNTGKAWYSTAANTSYFEYTSSTVNNAGADCQTTYTCHTATRALCARTNRITDKFKYTSTSVFGGSDTGACSTTEITGYKVTGCNTDKGWYDDSPDVNTSFFKVTSSSTTCSVEKTCFSADCDAEQYSYSSIPNTSFFKVATSSTWNGKTCNKCDCRYTCNEDYVAGYFDTQDIAAHKTITNICGSNPAKCLNNSPIAPSDGCHLTFDQRCTGSQEIIVYENSQSSKLDHDTGDDTGAMGRKCANQNEYINDGYSKYYLWGSPKTCGATTRRKPTGCNADKGAHNGGYGELNLSSSSYTSYFTFAQQDSWDDLGSEQPTKYRDIFVEHSNSDSGFTLACNGTDGDGIQCYVGCSCNRNNGWYESAVNARNAAGVAANADVVEVKSTRGYAYYTNSAGSVVADNSGSGHTQTCYKAPKQENDYFCINFEYRCDNGSCSPDDITIMANDIVGGYNNWNMKVRDNNNRYITNEVLISDMTIPYQRYCYKQPSNSGHESYNIITEFENVRFSENSEGKAVGYTYLLPENYIEVRKLGALKAQLLSESYTDKEILDDIDEEDYILLYMDLAKAGVYMNEYFGNIIDNKTDTGELLKERMSKLKDITFTIKASTTRKIFFKAKCHGIPNEHKQSELSAIGSGENVEGRPITYIPEHNMYYGDCLDNAYPAYVMVTDNEGQNPEPVVLKQILADDIKDYVDAETMQKYASFFKDKRLEPGTNDDGKYGDSFIMYAEIKQEDTPLLITPRYIRKTYPEEGAYNPFNYNYTLGGYVGVYKEDYSDRNYHLRGKYETVDILGEDGIYHYYYEYPLYPADSGTTEHSAGMYQQNVSLGTMWLIENEFFEVNHVTVNYEGNGKFKLKADEPVTADLGVNAIAVYGCQERDKINRPYYYGHFNPRDERAASGTISAGNSERTVVTSGALNNSVYDCGMYTTSIGATIVKGSIDPEYSDSVITDYGNSYEDNITMTPPVYDENGREKRYIYFNSRANGGLMPHYPGIFRN